METDGDVTFKRRLIFHLRPSTMTAWPSRSDVRICVSSCTHARSLISVSSATINRCHCSSNAVFLHALEKDDNSSPVLCQQGVGTADRGSVQCI